MVRRALRPPECPRGPVRPVPTGRSACRPRRPSLDRNQPDVPVLHGVAVVLQQDWAGPARVAAQAGRRVVGGNLHVVVDFDSVMDDRNPGGFGLFAARELRGGEVNVVTLPDGWGLAGV